MDTSAPKAGQTKREMTGATDSLTTPPVALAWPRSAVALSASRLVDLIGKLEREVVNLRP